MPLKRKTAYELSESQVTTPQNVVSLVWRLMKERREHLESVLDVGAGDCRFALNGNYDSYTGVEIDSSRSRGATLPPNAKLVINCAFRHRKRGYSACIGNPPYVRHHDIESPWKQNTVQRLERELGVSLDKHCNLYLYFLCLGLLKTDDAGLLTFLIPYEWVSRPSARAVREYIRRQGWDVAVYRFQKPIFEGVLTTASVSIVDKAGRTGRWSYHDIDPNMRVVARGGAADSGAEVLDYAERGDVWTLRGLSPGSQAIFTLTEGERLHYGLSRRDVKPCVTTLKDVPRSLRGLTRASFKKHFIESGARCWLIQSQRKNRSAALNAYLASVLPAARDTYTCRNQEPWFRYTPHPVPKLLVSSGFTAFGPKVLVNSVGAHAVGSVLGVHSAQRLAVRELQQHLFAINFEERVVGHAKTLRKLEVKQLNAILNAFTAAHA